MSNPRRHPNIHNRGSAAGKIAAIYLVSGLAWIFGSDHLLHLAFQYQPDTLRTLQTLKGGFYVVATAATLYYLINREIKANLLANGRLKSTLTNLIESQRELKSSQNQFAAFMKNSPAAAWISDIQGTMKYVSPSYLKMFHVADSIIGRNIFELYPSDIAQAYLDNIQTVANSNQAMETIEPGIRFDGEPGQFLVYKFPLSKADGTMQVGGMAIDITERKAREEEFKALAENAPDIISRFDSRLRHLYVNPAVTKATGLLPQAFIGKTNAELGMPEAQLMMWNLVFSRAFITGEEQHLEFQFPTPDGLRDFDARCVPEFAPDNTVVSVLVVARDITDQKQLERMLRQELAEAS
ncbi:MAG TPA: PAS domain-containing protein [Coleofasciculaceae cyanobacterium]|jgi:PAS domain S-box-containing protein